MPPTTKRTPCRIFIGSSSHALPAARGLRDALKTTAPRMVEVRVWDECQIRPPNYTLEELERLAWEFDFAAFIFAADDELVPHNAGDARRFVTRDNVICEYGLFVSALSRQRVFVVPEDAEEGRLAILADINGVTTTPAYTQPTDGNYMSEMQLATRDIMHCVREIGCRPGLPRTGMPALSLSVGIWTPTAPQNMDLTELPGRVMDSPEATVMVAMEVGPTGTGLRGDLNRYVWAVSRQTPALREGFGLYHTPPLEDGSRRWWLDVCAGEDPHHRWGVPAASCDDDLPEGAHHFAVTWSQKSGETQLWLDGGEAGHGSGRLRSSDGKVLRPDTTKSTLGIGFYPNRLSIHHAETRFRDFLVFSRALSAPEIADWAHFSMK